jgi:hypothetical protein
MWSVGRTYDWLKSWRSEWRLFHDNSVFEAVIIGHPSGGVVLRYLYRGEPYDEQLYARRGDARRDAATMHLRLKTIGWREERTSEPPAHPRMRT